MTRYSSYIICTAPRSGSTLLCHLLRETGVAGWPGSHFHAPSLESWARGLGLDGEVPLARLFAAGLAKGRGHGSLCGLRMQAHSFPFFRSQLAELHPEMSSDAARLRAVFGSTLFIYLQREDKIEQAVSYEIARQSGLWHRSADGAELERLSSPQDPRYNDTELRQRVEEFIGYDREWDRWFAENDLDPLHLVYADLAAAPLLALERILDKLGLDPAIAANLQPGVQKLADATNAEWKARFLSSPEPLPTF